ncbi:Hypothetical predicted protein [Cloeon dipterum]|uniref:Luciferin 4-monooxygenase n=1 Tax=Cloeon dipterum TaxID=197152 RepID=A0A8S1DDA7_9INSE|nr:Hypothetical predicted protein [Cloeon dipterum]
MLAAYCRRFKGRSGVRLVSTTMGNVDYDPETHVIRSNLSVQVPELTVSEYVWQYAHKWEHLPALTCAIREKVYTYGEAKGASTAFGVNLANELDLKDGDAVALLLPNMPEFALAFLGSTSAGLVVSTANPIYTAAELGHQFGDARVHVVVTTPELAATSRAALPDGAVVVTGDAPPPQGCLSFERLASKSTRGARVPPRPSLDSMAALPYSSGTTGKPKGVVLSHRNLVTQLCQLHHPEVFNNANREGHPQAKSLAILPLFHIYGLNAVMNLALSRGHNVVTLPRFEPGTFVRTMKKYKPNTVCVAPPLLSFLLQSPDLTREDLSELRFAVNGAAPAATSVAKGLTEKINNPVNFILKEGFGMTEVSCCAAMTPTTQKNGVKYGSCGMNVPLSEIKVVDDAGNALPLGQTGELLFRAPNVMLGYLNNEKATKETLLDGGWLRTGDMAYIDSDGYIFIVDRLKELIKVKGYQVSPTELEETLRQIPEVLDVAVVGIPDEKSGELPKAFVVRKSEQLSKESVVQFLEGKVAPYKYLKGGVQFVNAIPRSTAGKILRKDLKSL